MTIEVVPDVYERARQTLWQIAGGKIVWLTAADAQVLNELHNAMRSEVATLHQALAYAKKREASLHERCEHFAAQAATEERRSFEAQSDLALLRAQISQQAPASPVRRKRK